MLERVFSFFLGWLRELVDTVKCSCFQVVAAVQFLTECELDQRLDSGEDLLSIIRPSHYIGETPLLRLVRCLFSDSISCFCLGFRKLQVLLKAV